jgi:hypothetical protein
MTVSFNYNNALSFMKNSEVENLSEFVKQAHHQIHQKQGPGSDYLGWVDWPVNYDKEEFSRVKLAAKRIQEQSDALIVIGIGGSYLGSKAAIEALSHTFHNQIKAIRNIFWDKILVLPISAFNAGIRRKRRFYQCDFQVRYNYRACVSIPYFPQFYGEKVWKRRSKKSNLCDN